MSTKLNTKNYRTLGAVDRVSVSESESLSSGPSANASNWWSPLVLPRSPTDNLRLLLNPCGSTALKTHSIVSVSINKKSFVFLFLFRYTNLSTNSNFFSNFSKVDAICNSCTFSSLPLGCVHNRHLNKPANENSIEPSSSLLLTPWRKPNSDFCLAFFLASSASFFSCWISCETNFVTWNIWRNQLWIYWFFSITTLSNSCIIISINHYLSKCPKLD